MKSLSSRSFAVRTVTRNERKGMSFLHGFEAQFKKPVYKTSNLLQFDCDFAARSESRTCATSRFP